jgi:hypothetical protein
MRFLTAHYPPPTVSHPPVLNTESRNKNPIPKEPDNDTQPVVSDNILHFANSLGRRSRRTQSGRPRKCARRCVLQLLRSAGGRPERGGGVISLPPARSSAGRMDLHHLSAADASRIPLSPSSHLHELSLRWRNDANQCYLAINKVVCG